MVQVGGRWGLSAADGRWLRAKEPAIWETIAATGWRDDVRRENPKLVDGAQTELKRLFCLGFFQGLLDCGFGERGHDGVAFGVGVEAVVADFGFEEAVVVDHGGEIVEIDVAVGGGVFFDPGVQFEDFFGRALDAHVGGIAVAIVAVVADGHDAGEHDADFVGVGEFIHRLEIAFDLIERHRAGVAGDVVGAGEDDDDFGLKSDDVGAKANEHLRRGLAADAAVDVGLAGEEAAVFGASPAVGDGITHEDDTLFGFGGRLDGGVGVVIAGDVGPVLEGFLGGGEFGAVAGVVGGRSLRWRLRVDCWGCEEGCDEKKRRDDFHLCGLLRVGGYAKRGLGESRKKKITQRRGER